MWHEYTVKRQTYEQLGEKYGYTKQTIQLKLDAVAVKKKSLYPKKPYVSLIVPSLENAIKKKYFDYCSLDEVRHLFEAKEL